MPLGRSVVQRRPPVTVRHVDRRTRLTQQVAHQPDLPLTARNVQGRLTALVGRVDGRPCVNQDGHEAQRHLLHQRSGAQPMQRRLALLVHRRHVGPVLQQELHDGQLVTRTGKVKWSGTLRAGGVDRCSGVDERTSTPHAASNGRRVDRLLPVLISNVDVRVAVQQHCHELIVVGMQSSVQGRAAGAGACVHVGPRQEQQLRHRDLARLRSPVQRGALVNVLRLQLSARFHKRFDHLWISVERSVVQADRLILLIAKVRVRAFLEQLGHLPVQPRLHRIQQFLVLLLLRLAHLATFCLDRGRDRHDWRGGGRG
mmetsp:Transcript_9260/g.29500  ORF Transcript_9260/g.29500 Transcript_9260/m.29500 type:complete len:313 (-) Transcript_9260:42-980(-)